VSSAKDQVVVVGGGVIGLCAAYYLLRSGREVLVLEREAEGGGSCSVGNAGMVVPSHFVPLAAPGVVTQGLKWLLDAESPFYVRPRLSLELARWGWLFLRHANEKHVRDSARLLRDLNMTSRGLFAELEAEGSFGLVQRGLLMLCETERLLEEEAELAEKGREMGLQAEVCEVARLRELEPGLEMKVVGGILHGDDCHLDPVRFLEELRRRIGERGGVIRYGERVVGVEDGEVVLSGGERVSGGAVVLAGGAWTPEVARSLGLKLPMQAGKGYSLTLREPARMPRLCSILGEGKVAVTPMGGRLRFGGTMEIGGNSLEVAPRRVEGIIKSACRVLPQFAPEDFAGVEPWAGLRPCSPDGLPYLGKVAGRGEVYVATGHSMMGLSLGPVTGEIVAEMVCGEETCVEIGKLGVGRFG